FGKSFGIKYHRFLVFGGLFSAIIYCAINYQSIRQFIFLLAVPLLFQIGKGIKVEDEPKKIDTFLKKMALTSLLFSVLFGLGLVI
ncbi:MAG: 1,4-dihydroxy-2-naphthoate polyprenyltransferase, partial [Bacteroidota bacterium]